MRSTERIQETYLALKISKNWVSSKIMTLLEKNHYITNIYATGQGNHLEESIFYVTLIENNNSKISW